MRRLALILSLLLPATLAHGKTAVSTYDAIVMASRVEPGYGLSNEDRWTPTPAEIAKAEQLVKVALTDPLADASYRQILSRFGEYKRQYFGVTEKGQKLLFINYFLLGGKAADHADASVSVDDGGISFFRAKVSLVAEMVKDIAINGTAGGPTVAMQSVEGVIMPIGVNPGRSFEGYFMPTPQQTSAAESIVREALADRKADTKMAAVFAKLSSYRRQYFGVTDKGVQKIFINYFIPEATALKNDGWRKEAVVVDDGGDDFFQALVDLNSGHCDITVNGEA